eukprot:SM000002S05790  [mRNA]  locus=s2:2171626:2171865:- [translate_table: standard]
MSFDDHGGDGGGGGGDGRVTGFVECRLTDDAGRNDVCGVAIFEARAGRLYHGTLYLTPVARGDTGGIDSYVARLADGSL